MIFDVRSDVFYAVPANKTEDGVPLEGLVFYVFVEFEDGSRFAHDCSFPNGRRYRHPEGFDGWARDAGQAEARAEALRAQIAAATASGQKLDPDHWNEIDPAYGSDAYQGLNNTGYFRNREIMEAHDAGEISANEASRLMMR